MAVDCQVNFVYHRSSWFTPVPFLRDNLSPYWMMAQLTAVLGSINLIQVHLITLMILLWSLSRHWPQSYPAFTGVTMPEFELTCDLYYVRAQLYTVHTFWRHCLVSKSRLHLMWHSVTETQRIQNTPLLLPKTFSWDLSKPRTHINTFFLIFSPWQYMSRMTKLACLCILSAVSYDRCLPVSFCCLPINKFDDLTKII